MPRLLIVAMFLLVGGCASSSSDFIDPTSAPYEITANPRILLDPAAPIEQISLHGVRLGDDESSIPEAKIHERDTRRGWVFMRDPTRYRIVNGKVVTLGCWDQRLLSQLGVNAQEDIERLFGKAELVAQISPSNTTYHFQDGQRRAIWDSFTKRLAAVNIGRPAATTEPAEEAESSKQP